MRRVATIRATRERLVLSGALQRIFERHAAVPPAERTSAIDARISTILSVVHAETDAVPRLLAILHRSLEVAHSAGWTVVQGAPGEEFALAKAPSDDGAAPSLAAFVGASYQHLGLVPHVLAEAESFARYAPPSRSRAAGFSRRLDVVLEAASFSGAAIQTAFDSRDALRLWRAVNHQPSGVQTSADTAVTHDSVASPIAISPAAVRSLIPRDAEEEKRLPPESHDLREAWWAFVGGLLLPVLNTTSEMGPAKVTDAIRIWSALFEGTGSATSEEWFRAELAQPRLPTSAMLPGTCRAILGTSGSDIPVDEGQLSSPELWHELDCTSHENDDSSGRRTAQLSCALPMDELWVPTTVAPATLGAAGFDAFLMLWLLRNATDVGETPPSLTYFLVPPRAFGSSSGSPANRHRSYDLFDYSARLTECRLIESADLSVAGLGCLLDIALGGCSSVAPRAVVLLVDLHVAARRAMAVRWVREKEEDVDQARPPPPPMSRHELVQKLVGRLQACLASPALEYSVIEAWRCAIILRLYFRRLKSAVADVALVAMGCDADEAEAPHEAVLAESTPLVSHRTFCADNSGSSTIDLLAGDKTDIPAALLSMRTPALRPSSDNGGIVATNVPALDDGVLGGSADPNLDVYGLLSDTSRQSDAGNGVELELRSQLTAQSECGVGSHNAFQSSFAMVARSPRTGSRAAGPQSASTAISGFKRREVGVSFVRDAIAWVGLDDGAFEKIWDSLCFDDAEYALLFALLESVSGDSNSCRSAQQEVWGLLLDLPTMQQPLDAFADPATICWEDVFMHPRAGLWRILYDAQIVAALMTSEHGGGDSASASWRSRFFAAGGFAAVVRLFNRIADHSRGDAAPLHPTLHHGLIASTLRIILQSVSSDLTTVARTLSPTLLDELVAGLGSALALAARSTCLFGEHALRSLRGLIEFVGSEQEEHDQLTVALTSERLQRDLCTALSSGTALGPQVATLLFSPLFKVQPSVPPLVMSLFVRVVSSCLERIELTSCEDACKPVGDALQLLVRYCHRQPVVVDLGGTVMAVILQLRRYWDEGVLTCGTRLGLELDGRPRPALVTLLRSLAELMTAARPYVTTSGTRIPWVPVFPELARDSAGISPWEAALEVLVSCCLFGASPALPIFLCSAPEERVAAFAALRVLLRLLKSSGAGDHATACTATLRRITAECVSGDPHEVATAAAAIDTPLPPDSAHAVSAFDSAAGLGGVSQVLRSRCGVVGLRNQGATCYASTVLQVWSSIPALREAVLREWGPALAAPSDGGHAHLVRELRRVLLWLRHGHLRAFAAASFTDACSSLRMFQGSELSSPRSQSDAGEFHDLLHDALEAHVEAEAAAAAAAAGADEATAAAAAKASVLSVLGSGATAKVTCCSSCGHRWHVRQESFVSLGLPLPASAPADGGPVTLRALLQARFESHHVVVECASCKASQRQRCDERISALPSVLVLQLFRFNGETGAKVHTRVTFDQTIDVRDFVVTPVSEDASSGATTFDLSGVLVHIGQSRGSGHYIAFVPARDAQVRVQARWPGPFRSFH